MLVADTSTIVQDVVRACCQPSPMDEFKSNTAHPTARLVLGRHGLLRHKNMVHSVPEHQKNRHPQSNLAFYSWHLYTPQRARGRTAAQVHNQRRAKPQKPIVVVEVVGRAPAWVNKNPTTEEATTMPRRRGKHPRQRAKKGRNIDSRKS